MAIKKSTRTEINPQSGNFLTLYIDIADDQVYIQDDLGIRALLSDYLPTVTGNNIYNSDGTIIADRTVDADGFSLTFENINAGIWESQFGSRFTDKNDGPNPTEVRLQNGFLVLNSEQGIKIEYQGTFIGYFPSGDGADQQVLGTDGAGNWAWYDQRNIYTNDGALLGDRVFDGGGFDILYGNFTDITTRCTGNYIVDATAYGKIYSGGILQLQAVGQLLGLGESIELKSTVFSRMWSEHFAAGTSAKVVANAEGNITLEIDDAVGTPYIGIKTNGTLNYKLPTTTPNAGDVLTAGSGTPENTVWAPASGTTGTSFASYLDYSDDKPIGTYGASTTLTSLGYNAVTAGTTWPLTQSYLVSLPVSGTIDPDLWTIDAISIMEAHLAMENGDAFAMYSPTGREYYIDIDTTLVQYIPFPRYDTTGKVNQFKIFWNNAIFYMGGSLVNYGQVTGDVAIFGKVPPNQSDADNLYVDGKLHIQDGVLQVIPNQGLVSGSQCHGIMLFATNSVYALNINVVGFNRGWWTSFILGAEFEKCLTTNCLVGWFNYEGAWASASAGQTVSQITWISCRAYILNGGYGWYLQNADNSRIISGWGEGGGADTAVATVYWDNRNISVCKNFTIQGFRNEIAVEEAVVFIYGDDMGTAQIENVFSQIAQTLVSLANFNGTNTVNLRNTNINTTPWNLANQGGNGGAWIFENVYIPGDGLGNFPETPVEIVDTVNFPNVWRTGTSPIGGAYTVPDANASIYRVQIPIPRPL